MRNRGVEEPWRSFLDEFDRELRKPTELHCFGGFVVTQFYGLSRATGDIDILESRRTDVATIARLAGKGSPLHDRWRIYVDVVTIADVPDDYETRLVDMPPQGLQHLRLKAFEQHDLALASCLETSIAIAKTLWRSQTVRGSTPSCSDNVISRNSGRNLADLIAKISLWNSGRR
jgi:hypothetical protein